MDPTTTDIVHQKEDIDIEYRGTKQIPQVPRRMNIEDFRDLPTYSAFLASGSTDPDARHPNLREDLLRLIQTSASEWNSKEPSILSLAHYPIKITTAEWMLYSLLMGRYVKFFEHSLDATGAWISQFESRDILELYRWRRRGQQSLHKLKMTRSFVEYWGAKDPTTPSTWSPLISGFQHLEEQIEQHSHSLEALTSLITSLMQLLDSHKTIAQAGDVQRLSYIAMLFIPLSYVSGCLVWRRRMDLVGVGSGFTGLFRCLLLFLFCISR